MISIEIVSVGVFGGGPLLGLQYTYASSALSHQPHARADGEVWVGTRGGKLTVLADTTSTPVSTVTARVVDQ